MNWFKLVSLICTAATVHGSRLPSLTRSNTELQSLKNTDCFCSASGPKITDNLDPDNEGLTRLVIFAYQKESTGEITIFIPQRKYQYCIQDFPLSTGKAYDNYEKHPINEIFKNLANKNAVIEEPVDESPSYESDEVISFESSHDLDVQDKDNDLSLDSNSANYKAETDGSVEENIPQWQIPVTDYITGRITGNSHKGPYYLSTESLEEQKIIPQKWISHASEEEASPSLINKYFQKNKFMPKETLNDYHSYLSQYDSDVKEDATPSQFDLYLNEGKKLPATNPHVSGVTLDHEDNISPYDHSGNDSSDENARSFEYDPPSSGEIIYHDNDDITPQNDSESELSEDDNSSQFDVYLNEGNYFPATKPQSLGNIPYSNGYLTPQFNSGEEHTLDEPGPLQTNQNYGLSVSLINPLAEKVRPSIFHSLLYKENPISQNQTPSSGGLLTFPQDALGKSKQFNHFLEKEVAKQPQSEREGEEFHVSGATNLDNIKIQDNQYVSYSSESNDGSAGSQNQHTVSNHMTFPTSNEYEYTSDSSESLETSNEDSEKGYNFNQPPLLLVEEIEENNSNDKQSLIDSDTEELFDESSEQSTENESLHFPEPSFSKTQTPYLKVLGNPYKKSVNRMVPLKSNQLHMNYINSKTLKGTYGGDDRGTPYRGSHETPSQISFNHWFQKQLKGIQDNGTEMPTKPAVIRSVMRAIGKTLRKNGLWVSRDGRLHSVNGKVYSLSNLKLQPLLIGRSVPYDHLIKIKGKYRVPPRTPFIEGLLMSMLKPTKILGIVPLGITSLSRRFNPNGEYMLQIERRKLDSGAQKALAQILPSRRSSSTLAVTSPNSGLNHLWQSVSDILRRGGTTVTKITGAVEGKEDHGARRHDHGLEGHVHSDGEDTSESDDDEVSPSFRIIGGISATGTGTPIASKGRSGID